MATFPDGNPGLWPIDASSDVGTIYGLVHVSEPSRVRYVGLTKGDPRRRLSGHFSDAARRPSYAVHHWISKHGKENVAQVILEEDVPLSTLSQREVYWIDYYGTYEDKRGLNLTRGGESITYSEKTAEKMSHSAKKRWENESDETRERRLENLRRIAKMPRERKKPYAPRPKESYSQGETHYKATISRTDVISLYFAVKIQGLSVTKVAHRVGTTPRIVSAIKHKESWRNLTDVLDSEWGVAV